MKDQIVCEIQIGIRLQEKVEKDWENRAFLSSYFSSVENGQEIDFRNKFITLFKEVTNTKILFPGRLMAKDLLPLLLW